MINRLRKDLNNVGSYNPGMSDGGEVSHDEMNQDADMIKNVLQKIIDEMNGLEANRIHPKMMSAKVAVVPGHDESAENPTEEASETPEEEKSELDPEVLKQLMDKAGTTDDSGSEPNDHMDELPSSLADMVRKKKGLM